MNIYGLSMDAILHAFILDEKINEEKGRPAQFSPEPLREFLNENAP